MATSASSAPSLDIPCDRLLEELKSLQEEDDKISNQTWERINNLFKKKFGDLFTAKSVNKAGRLSADNQEIVEKELVTTQNATENTTLFAETNQKHIAELEKLVEDAREDANRSTQNLSIAESEYDKLQHARDTAVSERDSLACTLQKRDDEIASLKRENKEFSQHLKEECKAKCSAILERNTFEVACNEAQDRQRQAEHALLLIEHQLKTVNEELNIVNDKLQSQRYQYNKHVLEMETELSNKNEILRDSKGEITNQNEINKQLTAKVENLSKKILDLRMQQINICENLKKEINSQNKLINIYKSMQDDSESKTNELTQAVAHLQKLLNDASEKYGDLETSKKQMEEEHDAVIESKNKDIASLKTKLETVNEVLKSTSGRNIDQYISELMPSAATTMKVLKSRLSPGQVYSQLVQVMKELAEEKSNNEELKNTISEIVVEIEARAPKFKQLQEEYDHVIESNAAMTVQLDILGAECNQLRHDSSEANKIANHYTKENNSLKMDIDQLSRQVCFLLKEKEMSRGGSVASGDQNSPNVTSKSTYSSDSSSYNMISNTMVTFNSIQELQKNNLKLLHIVRELTAKLEKVERNSNLLNNDELEQKLQDYMIRINELTEARDRQTKIMSGLVCQRDMYKKLYDSSSKSQDGNHLHTNSDSLNNSETSNKDTLPEKVDKSTVLGKLQSQLQHAEKQLADFKEEHKSYKEEKIKNEHLLIEKIDRMQMQISDLSVENGKCLSLQEYNNERYNILQANAATYKKQIATLEEKSKVNSTTIMKQEDLIKQLEDKAMNLQRNASRAEVILKNTRRECQLLKDAESRLKAEREMFLRDSENQSMLLSNIESIKASVQRAETETQAWNETILSETLRECNAMRLREQEIQNENLEIQKQLQAKYDAAVKDQEEEKKISLQLRKELEFLQYEIDEKTRRIDELNIRLMTPSGFTPTESILEASLQVANLESQLAYKSTEIELLNKQLTTADERIKCYYDLTEVAEKELQAIKDKYSEYKEETEKRLSEFEQTEAQLRQKCAELESELALPSDRQYRSQEADLNFQLANVKNKLDIALKDLEKKSSDLIEAKERTHKLFITAQNAEQKYAHEMILHSSDIQILNEVKAKLVNVTEKMKELTNLKDQAIENLENTNKYWETQKKLLFSEQEEILTNQSNVIQHNSDLNNLHKQVETLSTQLTISFATKHSDNMNESVSDIPKNLLINDDKSSEQLLQINKCLKGEKNLIVAKFDILQVENKRLQSQLEITSKKLSDLKLALSQERKKNDTDSVAAAKQSELVRKVETLNALSDSNRLLREERDNLAMQVVKLTVATNTLEDQISPLQEENKELSTKVETLQKESVTLFSEVEKWRARCKVLVERADNTIPDDWKRLQNEKESLSKMLFIEQENVKKLNNEMTNALIQKSQVEDQLSNAKKQVETLNEEIKRLTDELNILKQEIRKVSQELNESKTSFTNITTEKSKILDTLALKETELSDIINKEMQVRKIAIKYKAQFEELTKTVEENKKKSDGETAVNNALEAELKSVQETNEKLKQDLEKLCIDNQNKEEKAKMVLKQAKNKIMQLTEVKTKLASQFSEAQKKVETFNQNRDENNVRTTVLTSQYEGRLARLEKEKSETLAERTKEIEALQQKVIFLQRQLTSQPGMKQPTMEKSASDPPTANIKPMAGINQPVVARGRAGDPTLPLASVRPTAAVPPSSPATTSASSLTPSPAPHITEYMPASSSRSLQGMPADGTIASTVTQEVTVPQQVVALVMPRMEGGTISEVTSAQQAPSSSAGSGTPARPAARVKRSRAPGVSAHPTSKRSRLGCFERSFEVEYQVPTSSRCDQEDDRVLVVDSEDDEDNRCTGTDAYPAEEADDDDPQDGSDVEEEESEANDDDAIAEDGDEVDEDMESGEEVGGDGESGEAAEGGVRSADIASSEIDAIQEQPAQSSVDELPVPDAATIGGSGDAMPSVVAILRRNIPDAPTVASATGYDDHDDGIVPSTPTLYVPRRNDGFGEAVSSPGANVGTSSATAAGRFTFATPALDDTHADLAAQLPRHGDVPLIVVSQAEANESDASGDATLRGDLVSSEASPPEDDASAVSSQGNQPTSPRQSATVEEGREAEASGEATPSGSPSTPGSAMRRGLRGTRRPFRAAHHNRPSPITWPQQDVSHYGGRGGQRPRRPYHHYK